MAVVSLVVVVDLKEGLGKNNQLLCHLPADLSHFKTVTWGKSIIMGRNTFSSIGKPLPGRRNIVLSRKEQVIAGVEVFATLADALEAAQQPRGLQQQITIQEPLIRHCVTPSPRSRGEGKMKGSYLEATGADDEVMVIGGGQVFQEALPYASRIYLTRIEHQFDADAFFPKLDDKEWKCVKKVHRLLDENNPYDLWFCEFERVDKTRLYEIFKNAHNKID